MARILTLLFRVPISPQINGLISVIPSVCYDVPSSNLGCVLAFLSLQRTVDQRSYNVPMRRRARVYCTKIPAPFSGLVFLLASFTSNLGPEASSDLQCDLPTESYGSYQWFK